MSEEPQKEVGNIGSVLRKDFTVRLLPASEEDTGFFSTIVDTDTQSFYLSPPVKGELEICLNPGDDILVHYYAPEALYEFKSELIGIVAQDGVRRYQLRIPRKGSCIQRRSFFRLPIGIEANFRLLRDELIGRTVRFTPSSPYSSCYIENISGGGISFYSNTFIEEGSFIEVKLELVVETERNQLIEIVKVVHAHSTQGKEGHGHYGYQYGGYFLRMKERTRDEIIRFINKKQSERLKMRSS